MPTVAIAADFLDAFSRIPRAQQKKVREFTEKFKLDPTSVAINYEKIHAMKDPKVRTVRIDQKYRAIILHPDKGDTHVLVWVDNHDEAMAWAENRSFDINPVTGALQVLSVKEIQELIPAKSSNRRRAGLFDALENAALLSFGIPAILLPAVKAISKKDELPALSKHLPVEAAEALTWLAEGYSPEEVREVVSVSPQREPVDPTDFAKALDHPDSRRRFVTIHSDDELKAMLDAPLEKWRIFLHPTQERLVAKEFKGPAKVIGGAGTGKTVVAMHRARHLARTLCTKTSDRILFTTYTVNLAENLEESLAHLCGDLKDRVEVLNLHAWAARLMRKHGIEFKIATNDEIERCWEEAIEAADCREFDAGFLKQELEQVVQANGIETRADYLKVSRTGRGRTLTRAQRAQVWSILEHYRAGLKNREKTDWLSVIHETRRFIEKKRLAMPYRAVIVDEAQDFHAEEWKLIRLIAPDGPNGLFLVGDAQQRIYGHRISLRQCGINIQGRSSQLYLNYRTTEQIRDWASALLNGMDVDGLDEDAYDTRQYKSLLSGPKPEFLFCKNPSEEKKLLGRRLKELLKSHPPEEICIVTRTKKAITEQYKPMLAELDTPHTVLERNREGKGVRLATMHRVKGLEFPIMILAGVNAGVVPPRGVSSDTDPVTRAERESNERSLLFVAATRARDLLLITCAGQPSPFLPQE